MGYRTIAAILQGKEDSSRVLDCAIPLARHWGAHLVGVHAEPLPVSYATSMGYPDAAFIAAASEDNKRRAAELLGMFRPRIEAEGLSAEWRGAESFSGDSGLSNLPSTRSVDLIIAQQIDPDAGSMSNADVEALIFESGRPVLLVPYAGHFAIAAPKRVLIAWNGSKESARATFDALPFIKQAEATEILCIDGDENGARITEIEAALTRHGAKVAVKRDTSDGIGIEEIIENRVADTGADLLVMGAYSESWLKEWLFGGTTRSLLKSMPALTLMSR
jgi:nucleotide-binding universal stress UspA family protein